MASCVIDARCLGMSVNKTNLIMVLKPLVLSEGDLMIFSCDAGQPRTGYKYPRIVLSAYPSLPMSWLQQSGLSSPFSSPTTIIPPSPSQTPCSCNHFQQSDSFHSV